MPQWQYGPHDTAHFAPGDTVEFMDPQKAEFHFASIVDFNLNDGPGGQPRAEAFPVTVAAGKTNGFLATCVGPCIKNIL